MLCQIPSYNKVAWLPPFLRGIWTTRWLWLGVEDVHQGMYHRYVWCLALTSVLEDGVFPGKAIVSASENGSIPTALLIDSLIIWSWSYPGSRERGNDSSLGVESSLSWQTVTGGRFGCWCGRCCSIKATAPTKPGWMDHRLPSTDCRNSNRGCTWPTDLLEREN